MPFNFHECSLFLSLEMFSKKITSSELSNKITTKCNYFNTFYKVRQVLENRSVIFFQTGIHTRDKAFVLPFCTDDHTYWITFTETLTNRNNHLYRLLKLTADNNQMSVENICHWIQKRMSWKPQHCCVNGFWKYCKLRCIKIPFS